MRTLPTHCRVTAFVTRGIAPMFLSFLISSSLFSQTVTHTFNYSYLDLKGCNIFSTAVNVNGYNHLTSVGFPYFSFGKSAVALQCGIGSSQNSSTTTRYSIAYPFKQYYSYAINAYAEGAAPSNNVLPYLGFLVSNSTDGTNSSLVCGGPGGITDADRNQYSTVSFGSSFAWLTSPLSFVSSQNYSYLIVSAYAEEGPSTDSVFVQQLDISETPPFTLTPASPQVVCGQNTAVTFTVVNNSNVSGITGYTWNLGSAANWLYNGSAAPATITTSTNQLVLTFNGGSALPSALSAKVSFNSTTFTTSVVTPQIVAPPPVSISGPAGICTTATYSIPGLPSNHTVTWSLASGAGSDLTLTPNSSNNTVTITNNNYYTENTTLIATISGSCYAPLSLPIAAASTTLSFTGTMNQGLCYNTETMTNQAMYTTGEPNFIWDYCPIVIDIAPYDMQATLATGTASGFSYSPGANPYQNGILNFTLEGSPISVKFYQYTTPGCPSQTIWFMPNSNSKGPNSFVVSPIPASGLITIAPDPHPRPTAGDQSPENNKNHVITQIRVFDVLGKLRQTYSYGTSVTQAQLDVSKLESGVYFMEISSGQYREVKRILVRH